MTGHMHRNPDEAWAQRKCRLIPIGHKGEIFSVYTAPKEIAIQDECRIQPRKRRTAECIASVGLTGPYANGIIAGPRIQFPLRHGKRTDSTPVPL